MTATPILRRLFQFPGIIAVIIVLLLLAIGGYWWLGNHVFHDELAYSIEDGYHIHADFRVMIEGEPLNFSKEQYMDVGDVLHLHDGNGWVMHHHAKNQSLGQFFETLNVSYGDTCLRYDNTAYCENASHSLTLLVNGTKVANGSGYVPQDLDRVLVSYHAKNKSLEDEMSQVTDEACIFSHRCPERGTPPPEACAGSSCVVSFE